MKTTFSFYKYSCFFIMLMVVSCQNTTPAPSLTPSPNVIPTSTSTPVPSPTQTLILTPTEIPAPLDGLSYKDRPDDHPDKYQIHVLYIVPKDFTDTTRYFDGSINESMRLMNEWFTSQADGQSFILDTYQGGLDITYITLPATEDEIFDYTKNKYGQYDAEFDGKQYLATAVEDYINKMNPRLFEPRKIYVAYVEISLAETCGVSQSGYGFLVAKVFPSAYSLRDSIDCGDFSNQSLDGEPNFWEYLLAHEIIHLLGFPNGSQSTCPSHIAGDLVHIFDPKTPNDIMEEYIGENPVLDPNHDDYYLMGKSCLDLADTPYLYP